MKHKRILNKKSQFFIFASVILIAMTMALFADNSRVNKKSDNFKEISDNYANEAPYVINSALSQGKDVTVQMEDFTERFMEYAKYQRVDFKVLYLLKAQDEILVSNRLPGNITFFNSINATGDIVETGEISKEDLSNEVIINYKQKNYTFSFGGIEDYSVKFIIVKSN